MAQVFKNSALRAEQIQKLQEDKVWDAVVIGSSPVGIGIALDAASRGFSVLLLQSEDFASGAAGSSSKIIEPDLNLLREPKTWSRFKAELKERRLLAGNAPDQTKSIDLIIPFYESFKSEAWFGLMSAVNLASPSGSTLGDISWMSATNVIRRLPCIKPEGLTSGVKTSALLIKDARLTISVLKTALAHGAVAANYMEVTGLVRDDKGFISAVQTKDLLSGQEYTVKTRMVFNCAGLNADKVRLMANPNATPAISFREAPRIAVESKTFEGDAAAFIPSGSGAPRFLCVPGELRSTVIMGPTPPIEDPETGSKKMPLEQLLERAQRVMLFAPTPTTVKSFYVEECAVWLPEGKKTWPVAGSWEIVTEFHNLITVVGSRWGNYRIAAEDAITAAVEAGLMYKRPCQTQYLSLAREPNFDRDLLTKQVLFGHGLTPDVLEYARYCHENEFAVSPDDVVLRRLRIGQLSQELAGSLIKQLAASEIFAE